MWKCRIKRRSWLAEATLSKLFQSSITARASLDGCYCCGLNFGLVGVHFGELAEGLIDLGSDPGVN